MNKKALVEFVRTSIIGQEATANTQHTYHFKRVEQGVVYAFDNLLSQMHITPENKRKIENHYVVSKYNQEVYDDGGVRLFVVDEAIVPMAGGKGVWYVVPSAGQLRAGRPIPPAGRGFMSVLRNIPAGKSMSGIFWRLGNTVNSKQNIIIESPTNSPMSDIRMVDYGIIVSLSEYSESDEVVVPDGRYDLLIDLVKKWLKNNIE